MPWERSYTANCTLLIVYNPLFSLFCGESVGTSDVGVTSLKWPMTQGYIVPGRLDDEHDPTTSASSWVEVVRRHKPVVKQSGPVLTLFTKRK
jgi:hypothetical protein